MVRPVAVDAVGEDAPIGDVTVAQALQPRFKQEAQQPAVAVFRSRLWRSATEEVRGPSCILLSYRKRQNEMVMKHILHC